MLKITSKIKAAFALILICAASLLVMPAYAQEFPKLTGRVVDQADLLTPAEEAALTAKLAALETNSNRQLVVTTLKDLNGYDIADYGYQLGRAWGIGQDGVGESEKDNGVLLIIAPNERRMRIEVGYGLEPILTDAISSRIIRRDITPQFKAKNFPAGINAGVDSIVTQLTLPPEEAMRVAKEAQKASKSSGKSNRGMVFFWLFIFVFFILPALRGMFGSGKKHRRSGYGGPIIIWGGESSWDNDSGSSWGGGGGFGGGFGGGGGGFGGGGASGGW